MVGRCDCDVDVVLSYILIFRIRMWETRKKGGKKKAMTVMRHVNAGTYSRTYLYRGGDEYSYDSNT